MSSQDGLPPNNPPAPVPTGQESKTGANRRWWIIGGAVVLAAIVVVIIIVIATGDDSSGPVTTGPAVAALQRTSRHSGTTRGRSTASTTPQPRRP